MKNWFYQLTGIAMTPTFGDDPDEAHLLDLPVRAQLNDCCCAVVAAWTVIRTLGDGAEFSQLYEEMNPDWDGVSNAVIRRVLKKHRVGCRAPRRKLTKSQICAEILAGYPIITTTVTSCRELHAPVIYGVSRSHIYLLNQGFLGLAGKMTWPEFFRIYRGSDLVCWGL